jgi:hypothetical protein
MSRVLRKVAAKFSRMFRPRDDDFKSMLLADLGLKR